MCSAGPAEDPRLAVNVIGFLDDALGLAQAARLYIDALRQPLGVPVADDRDRARRPAWGAPAADRALMGRKPNLIQLVDVGRAAFNLALPERRSSDQSRPQRRGRGACATPQIGQWAWETDVLPGRLVPAFHLLEEIWAFSTFVGDNLGPLSPVPVGDPDGGGGS